MIKPDEMQLMKLVVDRGLYEMMPYVRDLAESIGMNPKRKKSLCLKWAKQGWYDYDYGVACDLGWVKSVPTQLGEAINV